MISSSLSAAIVVDYFSHKLILHPAASFNIAAVRPVHCATAQTLAHPHRRRGSTSVTWIPFPKKTGCGCAAGDARVFRA